MIHIRGLQFRQRFKVKVKSTPTKWTFFIYMVMFCKTFNMKNYVYVHNAGSEDYKKKLEMIHELGIDPFGREYIEDARFEAKKILYETPYWFAFENQHKYQGTKHQFVVVAQTYAEDFPELPPKSYENLFALKKQICDDYGVTGGGILFFSRFGDPALSGATVYHLHAQIVVPEEDGRIAAWFGKKQIKQ